MSFLFGPTTPSVVPKTPIVVEEVSLHRLRKRTELVNGFYQVNTRYGVYVGDLVDQAPHGTGLYTWTNGNYEEGQWEEGRFLSGTLKRNNVTYQNINMNEDENKWESENGTINYGNGITFQGTIKNKVADKGTYVVAPNTPIEFTDWRNIQSGHKGILTKTDNWWVQTYTTGRVREIKTEAFNPITMHKRIGKIEVVFSDLCVYKGMNYSLNDDEEETDVFVESASIGTEFKNWNNYQLDYWLVANRGLDHFPGKFFCAIRDNHITGIQLLNFDDECLYRLGLTNIVWTSQLRTILSRFSK